MGGVSVNAAASAAAEASGGEQKNEADDDESLDAHGFLGAAPSDGEPGIRFDG
jgi:hypothetical protein